MFEACWTFVCVCFCWFYQWVCDQGKCWCSSHRKQRLPAAS